MKIEPFKPEHLLAMSLLDSQPFIKAGLSDPSYATALAEHGAYTAVEGERVLGCGGLVQVWPGRFQAWAVLDKNIGPHQMTKIHRAVSRFLALQTGRVEAVVATGFAPGHRWVRLLGFTRETEVMRGWLPGGGDAIQYARAC